MRVKVGDKWYSAKVGQPIMVKLSPGEREQIAHMAPDKTKYAQFHDDEKLSKQEMFDWMVEGEMSDD